MKKYEEIIISFFIIFFSIVIFILSFSFKREVFSTLGPGFMPRLIATMLFILGWVRVFQCLMVIRKKPVLEKKITGQPVEKAPFSLKENLMNNLDWVQAFIMMIYVFSIKHLGFIIASTLYLFFSMFVTSFCEKRNLFIRAGIAIGSPIIIYLIFTKVFHLMLPEGILG